MQIKEITVKTGYIEAYQPSSLRWRLLRAEEGDTYVTLSGWFKCKDYMADVVVRNVLGLEFQVHGFDNTKTLLNKEGGYLQVKDFDELFTKNLDKINELIQQELDWPSVVYQEGPNNTLVLFVPMFYWTNTMFISVILSLIRSCAYGEKAETLEGLVWEPTLKHGYFQKALNLIKKNPKELFDKQVVYVHGATINSQTDKHLIHDSGLQAWAIGISASNTLGFKV